MNQLNLINIPCSPGELIDKMTILAIKQDQIDNQAKLKYINEEIKTLLPLLNNLESLLHDYSYYYNNLKSINLALWNIEDDLRAMEAAKKFDDEFIEKARLVYKTNDKRAALKLEINQILGSNIAEQKQHPTYNH